MATIADVLEDGKVRGVSHSFTSSDLEKELETAILDADLKLTHALVQNGANLTKKNHTGKIPLDIATDTAIQTYLKGYLIVSS
jgi:hypothetical protein